MKFGTVTHIYFEHRGVRKNTNAQIQKNVYLLFWVCSVEQKHICVHLCFWVFGFAPMETQTMTTRQASANTNAQVTASLRYEKYLEVMDKESNGGEPIVKAHCKKHSNLKVSVEKEFIRGLETYGESLPVPCILRSFRL